MFNRARYNVGRFNVWGETTVVLLFTDAYETIAGIFHVAENVHLLTSASEKFHASAKAAQGVLLITNAAEDISGTAQAIGAVLLGTNAQEVLSADVSVGATLYLSTEAAERLVATICLGADVYLSTEGREAIAAALRMGAEAYLKTAAYEIISAVAEAEANELVVVVLDVALAPGDTLIIDSDSDRYLVLHNGEVALDKHKGDWIRLSRSARAMLLESGTPAGLEASVLYTERYL